MAENSAIEWTDHTFNAIIGCTKVSPGCKFCYAERDMSLRLNRVAWGPDGTRVLTSDANWKDPIKWNKEAGQNGIRYRVFTASLSDVFENWDGPILNHKGQQLYMPHITGGQFVVRQESHDSNVCRPVTMNDVRQRLFDLIDHTPNLDWLVLTKRPENILRMWPDRGYQGFMSMWVESKDVRINGKHMAHRPNVMIGTSVENQQYANERIPHLLACKDLARGTFLSAKPLLGPIEFSNMSQRSDWKERLGKKSLDGINWVIVGGESGPSARPMNPDWARSIRDQCEATGVAFMFKQWGEWAPCSMTNHITTYINADTHAFDEESQVYRIGKKQAGRLLDGVQHDGFPQCL